MKRSTLTAARLLEEGLQRGGFRYRAVMVGLTYRQPGQWRARHVKSFCKALRRRVEGQGARFLYSWVAELQRRGAVHYHVVLWVPLRVRLPYPDQGGLWNHGSSNITACRVGGRYLAKYVSKGDDGQQFPKGLRLHGRGGLDEAQRRVLGWWLLPRYVREAFPEVGAPARRFRHGWLDESTGEWVPAFVGPLIAEGRGDFGDKGGRPAAPAGHYWSSFPTAGGV